MDSMQKNGYFKDIEVLEEIVDDELGISDRDLYCKETIQEFIEIMLDKMKSL